jgi:hypothetical protein
MFEVGGGAGTGVIGTDPEVKQIFESEVATADEQGLLENIVAQEVDINLNSDQHNADSKAPEMSSSHPEVDLTSMTEADVVEACTFLARVAKENPELAYGMVQKAREFKKQEVEARQSGKDEKALERQQWEEIRRQNREKAEARARAKEKLATEEAASETKQASPDQSAPERVAKSITKEPLVTR